MGSNVFSAFEWTVGFRGKIVDCPKSSGKCPDPLLLPTNNGRADRHDDDNDKKKEKEEEDDDS
jgi:hypothetical protein